MDKLSKKQLLDDVELEEYYVKLYSRSNRSKVIQGLSNWNFDGYKCIYCNRLITTDDVIAKDHLLKCKPLARQIKLDEKDK